MMAETVKAFYSIWIVWSGKLSKKNIIRLAVVIVIVVVLAVSAIAIYSPLIPWPFGSDSVETPAGILEPGQKPPESVQPSVPKVEPAVNPPVGNKLVLSEKELQDKISALVAKANQSADIELEFLNVKLEQDKMLVSTKGTAFGIQAEMENLEMRFDGRTVFATGQVKALGLSPTISTEIYVNSESGKLSIELRSFKGLPLTLLNLSKEKIASMVNDAITSRGIRLPYDLESISIADSKLVIEYE